MTIYLTADERLLFDRLPANLREGCDVLAEDMTFKDTPEEMKARWENLQLSEAFAPVQQQMAAAESMEDIVKIIQAMDFETMDQRDAGELFYAMGPTGMSLFVAQGLEQAKTADHVAMVADFTCVRHVLLASLQTA